MFTYRTTIKLHHTDAAGLLFFGSQFYLAHDAYEAFVESIGFSTASVIQQAPFLLPLIHAEADYLGALFVGDQIVIELTLDRMGTTSFAVTYNFRNAQGQSVGKVQTVHVAVDKKSRSKIPLPDELKAALLQGLGDPTPAREGQQETPGDG